MNQMNFSDMTTAKYLLFYTDILNLSLFMIDEFIPPNNLRMNVIYSMIGKKSSVYNLKEHPFLRTSYLFQDNIEDKRAPVKQILDLPKQK